MLHNHDLFELVNFCLNVVAAILGILVEKLHIVKLLVQRHHHLEHHASVLIEYVLLDSSAAVVASLILIHDIVDDLSNLILICLQHLNLALHQLCLAVHE